MPLAMMPGIEYWHAFRLLGLCRLARRFPLVDLAVDPVTARAELGCGEGVGGAAGKWVTVETASLV